MQEIIQNDLTEKGLWSRELFFLYAIFISFVVGFFGIINGSSSIDFSSKTEIFLLIIAILGTYFTIKKADKLNSYKIRLWLIASFVGLLSIEIFFNINTAFFGKLDYGSNFKFEFLDIPIVIILIANLSILAGGNLIDSIINKIKNTFKSPTNEILEIITSVLLGSTFFIIFLNLVELILPKLGIGNIQPGYGFLARNTILFVSAFILLSFAKIIKIRADSFFLKSWFILQFIFILGLIILL